MTVTILEKVKVIDTIYRKEREKYVLGKFNSYYDGMNDREQWFVLICIVLWHCIKQLNEINTFCQYFDNKLNTWDLEGHYDSSIEWAENC